jgi:hypothetical protein
MRLTTAAIARMAGIATVVAVAAIVPFAGTASAAASATITTPGPYTDGETVTVTGSGFPIHSALPSGLTIAECADPGGVPPTDNTTCDGSTVNPLPVNTDASGAFSTSYTLVKLSTVGGASNIDCDATNECTLWVGVDFNNNFLGTHAFTSPGFLIGSPTTGTPEAPVVIALPVGAALLFGGTVLVARRRRAHVPT